MEMITMENKDERKPYTSPEIITELELETRAGSRLSVPDPFDDPLGLQDF
jgi:hypothetical protein